MQIMNLLGLVKNIWWSVSAFNTINNLPDAIIYVNNKGFIEQANKKAFRTFGFVINEENPIIIDDYIYDGMEILKTSAEENRPVPAIAKIPGREFPVEINTYAKRNGYCVSIRDLTKLTNSIETEEKIARFNGEKNAMLVKIEGEIKSPISSVIGFSKGLLDGIAGDLTDKQKKYIKIINSNSNELYHFMDKFLEFTYAESSLYEQDYQKFDVVEALKAVIKDFEPAIDEKKLNFNFEYSGLEKRIIYSDLKAIKKIFENIMETSVSMTDSGFIMTTLSQVNEETASELGFSEGKYLKLSVKDTGVGLADEEMKYLCDPYAQLEKGKKNLLRAIRLGTASILTKRTDGYINITSEMINGAEYNIYIPLKKD